MDAVSKKQLAPKVVVAIQTTRGQNDVYSVYKLTGSGKVQVFQNGTVIKGTWSRKSTTSPFVLKDSNEQTIKLVPGQTWVTLVTAGGVSYKP